MKAPGRLAREAGLLLAGVPWLHLKYSLPILFLSLAIGSLVAYGEFERIDDYAVGLARSNSSQLVAIAHHYFHDPDAEHKGQLEKAAQAIARHAPEAVVVVPPGVLVRVQVPVAGSPPSGTLPVVSPQAGWVIPP